MEFIRQLLTEQREERYEKPKHDNHYIYNPSILDVEVGNMIRVKEHQPNEFNMDNWGTIVLDVDYKKGAVLVGESLGYPKERKEWVPIDDVIVTWNIGGYEKAMDLIDKFGKEVRTSIGEK